MKRKINWNQCPLDILKLIKHYKQIDDTYENKKRINEVITNTYYRENAFDSFLEIDYESEVEMPCYYLHLNKLFIPGFCHLRNFKELRHVKIIVGNVNKKIFFCDCDASEPLVGESTMKFGLFELFGTRRCMTCIRTP